MRYLLTILTNGRRECLERTLAAFMEHVTPPPTSVFVMDDGEQTGAEFVQSLTAMYGLGAEYASSPSPLGACRAQARCWLAAAESDLPWTFHIEDDFVIVRPTNLNDLRRVLDTEPTLEQMALMRAPWAHEIEWGGFVRQAGGWYERRTTVVGGVRGSEWRQYEWIVTKRNWTNSPALYPTAICRELAWPEENCETRTAENVLALRPDSVFGLWGHGEFWTAHIGVERAPGAHGY